MRILFLFFIGLLLIACNNNARNNRSRKAAAGDVYYEYQVWAEEGNPGVTVTLEYLKHGGDGPGERLKDSAGVRLDGNVMRGDSSLYNGTIYETVQPAAAFTGRHTLSFVDDDGKTHEEEFRFEPFSLAEELPERLKKEPFTLKLKNFPAESKTVQLILTDTSFASRDVNETVPVENGTVHVSAGQLANLVAGPVSLQLYHERERPLKQIAKESGRIQMMYSLRREIELVN